MAPRPGYRDRAGLFAGLAHVQMRHVVAIYHVLMVILECHPHMMSEALGMVSAVSRWQQKSPLQ